MEQAIYNRKRLCRVGIHVAAVLICVGIACGVLLFTPLRIPCPLYALTGLQCPFCGGTRMAEALLRLDFAAAFDWNPYLMIALPLLFLLFAAREWIYLRGGTYRFPVWQRAVLIAIAAAGAVFGVIRNMVIF